MVTMMTIGLFAGLVVFVAVLLAWPTMLLWNWLMPYLFGLPVISFWQSLGLCLLFRCLFGTGDNSVKSKK
jgi:hypothetical protein